MWLIRIESRGEVHRVHLGEVRVADQVVPGADERGGQRVALGRRSRSPSPSGSRRRRTGAARSARPRRSRRSASSRRRSRARSRSRSSADLHARVVLALRRPRAAGRSRSARPPTAISSATSRRADRRASRGAARPGAIDADLRAERAQQRALVEADVAHVVHRVAEHCATFSARHARHRGRRARPAADRARGTPSLCQSSVTTSNVAPGAHHRVRGVLGAVDALVVGHVRHVPRGGDLRLGLHVGQAQREPRLAERAGDAHGRARR